MMSIEQHAKRYMDAEPHVRSAGRWAFVVAELLEGDLMLEHPPADAVDALIQTVRALLEDVQAADKVFRGVEPAATAPPAA
jgi:hypothetical protein